MSSLKKVKRTLDENDSSLVSFSGALPENVEKKDEFCKEYRWFVGSVREYYINISSYKIDLQVSKCEIQLDGNTLKLIAIFRNDEDIATEIFDLGCVITKLNPDYKCYLSTNKNFLTIECHRQLLEEKK